MTHTVVEGDSIPSIAFAAGLFPDTIWNHAENEQLKELRQDMNILFPGDQVYVPDKEKKIVTRAIDNKYKFVRKGVPCKLRLQLFNVETPRANQDYELVIGATTYKGTTDANGVLEEFVPPDATEGKLTIGEDGAVFALKLGHMDPLGELAGIQNRLANLGYECGRFSAHAGDLDGKMDDATRSALLSFQRRFQLEETGELDNATKALLDRYHDKNGLFDPDPWLVEA